MKAPLDRDATLVAHMTDCVARIDEYTAGQRRVFEGSPLGLGARRGPARAGSVAFNPPRRGALPCAAGLT